MNSMKNKIAVVVSDYYKDITDGLLTGINSNLNENFKISKNYFNARFYWWINYSHKRTF